MAERAGGHALPRVAEAARRLIAEGVGVLDPDAIADTIAQALRDDAEASLDVLSQLILDRLVEAFLEARSGAKREQVDFDKGRVNCREIAREIMAEGHFFNKLARWISVNVCFWAREAERDEPGITGDSVAGLVTLYAEDSAQAVTELLSPPNKPLATLEGLLGVRDQPKGRFRMPDIPQGTLVVLSSGHFQSLREALYKNTFRQVEGTPWPTAELDRGGAKGFAQLRPPILDNEPLLPQEQMQAWAQTMWRQQSELSDLDADALDALCAIYLSQARDADDAAVADVDEILAMRGLQPKRGGAGRRGGYEPEQREEMLRALSHIQNLWINIAEVKVYERDARGRRSGEPSIKTLQSRPFIITDRMGQMRLDGYMDVERFIFRPGKAFAAFLFGSGRQTGLLFQKALQYDPYRRKWEKRLTRYVSWHWRAMARTGEFTQTYRVQTLLDAAGETLNDRYPAKTRARLEKALDSLQEDGVIATWQYARWDEATTEQRGWGTEWLTTTVTIEAPDEIKDYYARLVEDERSGAHSPPAAPARPRDLGEAIRRQREGRGLTQMQVAEMLGIRQGYLSKIERGKLEPSAKLAKVIETWLLEGAEFS
ncbi:MAG: helix-turn-helix transcriptional regulator [Alphaproteobacteria bacterium]|nr:helix-turn-helix transcriptional regulator [Alphaproteobacteria bacterium]